MVLNDYFVCYAKSATILVQKIQKDKQRSTKHTHETRDRVTRTPLKTEGELRCSGSVHSPCSTSGTIPEGLAVPALET
jgi:hypothetical protein